MSQGQYQEVYSTRGQTQPSTCPVDYVTISKDPSTNTLKVETKNKSTMMVEPPKYFSGPRKWHDFQQFWNYLSTNVAGFNTCTNPMQNDSEYTSWLSSSDNSSSSSSSSGSTCSTQRVINWRYFTRFVTWRFILNNLFLFTLIFVAITYIPKVKVAVEKRIIVGISVCVVYSLLDVFTGFIQGIGGSICHYGCGC